MESTQLTEQQAIEAARDAMNGSRIGLSSAELRDAFPSVWEKINEWAEKEEECFYKEEYHTQHWGRYYRIKSHI